MNLTQSMGVEKAAINTIRTLSMDAVQKANSGHPGTPMALAPVGYVLWQEFLRYDPKNPLWADRDRFVLSVGHASMLLYSLLHLTDTQAVNSRYETSGRPAVSLDDIKRFRQLDSKCPGHPEYRLVTGVETTTGPLGQGVANSVGMAIASRWMAAKYNRPGHDLFGYNVYALCGDGDMMEGISSESASIAGHLQLSNLCWIYDSNRITIDGPTKISYHDNAAERFKAYGWRVRIVDDANDLGKLRDAFRWFQSERGQPALIIVNSQIGYGAPHKQNTSQAHGEPLGEEEVRLAKKNYGWPEDAHFLVPDGVYEHFQQGIGKRGASLRENWDQRLAEYRKKYPEPASEIDRILQHELPQGWDSEVPTFAPDPKGMATRESSAKVQNAIAKKIPWMLGGSADLAASTKTTLKFEGAGELSSENPGGRNMHFGIREHAMGAIVNGLALSGLRPYGSTFLIFSDYERPAIRLSSIMELNTIQIFTHDSIGVGEDGPTHQPIEQLASLRSIPGLVTLRPGDANEVADSWRVIMNLSDQPAALVLTRQPIPTIDRSKLKAIGSLERGAYVIAEAQGGVPDLILIGTGSEVSLCLQARERLEADGIRTRVVSMPSWDLYEKQDASYKESILPPQISARVSVEQASTFGWDRYVGSRGVAIGMRTFGASAPLKDLLAYFGFTVERVVETAKGLLR